VFGNLKGEGDIEAKIFKGKVLTKTKQNSPVHAGYTM